MTKYGKHYPNALAAVDFIYGPDGTWKDMNPLEYKWNYYNYPNLPPEHPYDKDALIAYANGTHFTTCLDANQHLLCDFNHDGSVTPNGGWAFCEHNAIGEGGISKGNPFTNFWFDDNWLARYMSQAYARTLPNGLSQYNDFNRWQIIGGGTSNWTPYPSGPFVDRNALNGMYYIAIGDITSAKSSWNAIVTNSGRVYNSSTQQYDYPSITENYHLGLFLILANLLSPHVSANEQKQYLQDLVSLRSHILSNQQKNSTGVSLGWTSHIPAGNSLINTESVACCVLGLGANADFVFESTQAPMHVGSGSYFIRPYHVVSAVTGLSQVGTMSFGPYMNFPTGRPYTVEFLLRAPSPVGKMATIEIYDQNSNQILVQKDLNAAEFNQGNEWTSFQLSLNNLANSSNSLEFRTFWHGTANLDLALVRVL